MEDTQQAADIPDEFLTQLSSFINDRLFVMPNDVGLNNLT